MVPLTTVIEEDNICSVAASKKKSGKILVGLKNIIKMLDPAYSQEGFVETWKASWSYPITTEEGVSVVAWCPDGDDDKFYYATGAQVNLIKISGNSVFLSYFFFFFIFFFFFTKQIKCIKM